MRIGVAIVKSVLFRGVQQEFSNVYHYDLTGAVTGPWALMLSEMVTTEKTFHSADVSFKRGQIWSAGGTPAQNTMLYQETLSGLGSRVVDTYQDRERAILIRWPAGTDSRGKPVFLRKWYHSCGGFAGVQGFTASVQQNTAQIPTADRTTIASAAAAMNEIGTTEVWQLCSASGRRWDGQPECHKYLEHHQLGDMWR